MPDQPLKEWLEHADRTCGDQPLITTDPVAWADQVRMRKRRQDRVRASAAAGSSALVLGLAAWMISLPAELSMNNQPSPPIPKRVIALNELPTDQPLNWRVDLEVSRMVAQQLRQTRSSQVLEVEEQPIVEVPAGDPIADALQLAEEASMIMVTHANRLDREYGLRRSSVQTYQRTVQLFPNSPYAAVAKLRLARRRPSFDGGTL